MVLKKLICGTQTPPYFWWKWHPSVTSLPYFYLFTIVYNVPRIPEVGDQRKPIWTQRRGTGYSLLYEVLGVFL